MIQIDFTTNSEIVPDYVVNAYGFKYTYDKDKNTHSYNDAPAIIYPDGTKVWYKHGKIHRGNDLPAAVMCDGSKFWCEQGKKHRGNGLPAVVWVNGIKEYWVDGKRIK